MKFLKIFVFGIGLIPLLSLASFSDCGSVWLKVNDANETVKLKLLEVCDKVKNTESRVRCKRTLATGKTRNNSEDATILGCVPDVYCWSKWATPDQQLWKEENRNLPFIAEKDQAIYTEIGGTVGSLVTGFRIICKQFCKRSWLACYCR